MNRSVTRVRGFVVAPSIVGVELFGTPDIDPDTPAACEATLTLDVTEQPLDLEPFECTLAVHLIPDGHAAHRDNLEAGVLWIEGREELAVMACADYFDDPTVPPYYAADLLATDSVVA